MFLDASVIIAIIAREQGWEEIVKRLETSDGDFVISPVSRFEAVLGLARKYNPGGAAKSKTTILVARAAVDEFLSAVTASEIAISPEIGAAALEAAMIYGKAVGHRADLNFGDCFSYACAKTMKIALCYKGDDFALTDLA
ncbi:type II toxin-antitoxin system VapC family toxin [Rhizobium sp. Root482]|uniref:type II toxin-antitoxin system VapC family toxin n=1 Tax=Rhizobium sp. Root482 TaxID=1736543 RepID=UPI0006FF6158|nr:type II toxin-antitoxin system VapC family toxin [Rhizobium sp. Root482]KQY14048.1 ribonuclease [Rhizobium sp. Root482]